MQALILFFAELCALRKTPQDLPASNVLFGLVVLAAVVVGVVIGLVAGLSFGVSSLHTVVELALTLMALSLALRLVGKPSRFLQAATALLGAGVVIGVIAILPLSLNPTGPEESDLAALGALLLLVIFVWSVVVTGHILRHTFGITLGQAAAITVAFKIAMVLVLGSLGSL
ncbi:hypothetical protein CKO25_08435 [Thiocapsa imhoffii]|uniref:Yip1 domain-containing protein n=1 Tax=Thiocapsa imhoffii TaxID=382777 RepID=A0A9X1B950_9GAMM|nr:hypothetical protein [Thiocapsa imhoffii]